MGESGLDIRRAARAGWDQLAVGRARGFVHANAVPHRARGGAGRAAAWAPYGLHAAFAREDVARVAAITGCLPRSHGAPLHIDDPTSLGIPDPDCTDWSEPLRPELGEEAVFWGCGLTALAAFQASGVPFFATHAPGAMPVTDILETVP